MADKTINFQDLGKPFPAKDIEWRIQSSGVKEKKPWAKVLAYVTNRAIMDRLDEVCGPENWCNYFEKAPNGGVLCGIAINVGGKWVTKWDGADNTEVLTNKKLDTDTNIKGGLSASMKRAGVQWDIGRYLYKIDIGWAVFSTSGKTNSKIENKWFKWDEPALPKWALPIGENPKKTPPSKKEAPKPPQQDDTSIDQPEYKECPSAALIESMGKCKSSAELSGWWQKNAKAIAQNSTVQHKVTLEYRQLKAIYLKSEKKDSKNG